MKVSIIIPIYNEEKTLVDILGHVNSVNIPFEKEILIINDGSTDRSSELLTHISGITVITHSKNLGKGAAIRTGIQKVTGDIVLFQDADKEYDINDYIDILSPFLDNSIDVVYGSRFIGKKKENFFVHTYLANKLLSFLTRLFIKLPVTDMETCYKAFRTPVIKDLILVEDRFGIEPEMTIKMARIPGIRYKEVPISYTGRSIKEGKKIRWYDGVRAIWCIVKYGTFG